MGKHFGEATVPEADRGPCPVFALYRGVHLTTEGKSRKNHTHDSRKMPSWTALGIIRYVDFGRPADPSDT